MNNGDAIVLKEKRWITGNIIDCRSNISVKCQLIDGVTKATFQRWYRRSEVEIIEPSTVLVGSHVELILPTKSDRTGRVMTMTDSEALVCSDMENSYDWFPIYALQTIIE